MSGNQFNPNSANAGKNMSVSFVVILLILGLGIVSSVSVHGNPSRTAKIRSGDGYASAVDDEIDHEIDNDMSGMPSSNKKSANGAAVSVPTCTEDLNLLKTLYNDFKGSKWHTNTGWLQPSSNCCQWFGVECNANGKVESLSLFDNHLSGVLSKSIGSFAELRHINLQHNSISGSIPSSIGNLKNLETLFLASNRMQGELPSTIGQLKNLNTLHLSQNEFSGELPLSLGNLTKLERLYLSYNHFKGSIPGK
jgi:Leucine-rich repeat (LRR) protein